MTEYIGELEQQELPNSLLNKRIGRVINQGNKTHLLVGAFLGLFTGLMLGPIVTAVIWG